MHQRQAKDGGVTLLEEGLREVTKLHVTPMLRFLFFNKRLLDSPLLFFRKKVAKSSVQGLRNCAPLLKTDRFGDPSPRRRLPHGAQFSVRFTCTLNMHQRQGVFGIHLCQASVVNLGCFGFSSELSLHK